MIRQLLVTAGPDKGRTFILPEADVVLLGRSRATETRLIDPHVSRLHCRVEVSGEEVVVSDNDSAGGTFVNGQRISGPHRLRTGDVIRIGNTELQLRAAAPDEEDTLPPGVAAGRQPAEAALPLGELAGQTISRYQIGQVLAKGQTGVVLHARDTEEDRPVAFKVLSPDFAENDEQRERFVRAMKTVLPLRHENLVSVHAAGKSGRYCWVAMEYVEGESLTQVVQRIGTVGMLDWRHALRIGVHIARALDYAHGRQVIHRNVTPMNILVQARDKAAKLGDLMLAKALEGALAQQITRPGELLGDVHYMSPERTYPSAAVDGRSDIYGLGATLYALLTGRPPFADVSLVETITKIRKAEPEKPTRFQMAIPALFEGVVLKMLAKRPEERYQTAGELLAELERVARFQGVLL
jgi:hypothetical protein